MKRAVFLDRDGVLNRAYLRDGKPLPPWSLEELEIIPEAADALRRLKEAGFLLLVVSNQPDVVRGTQSLEVIEAINAKLEAAMPIDEFLICYHDDRDDCDCRKPKPGLLLQGAEKWDVDLARSFMVGDRWRDIDAGANAGCRTVLIDYSYGEREPAHAPDARAVHIGVAAEWILSQR